MRDEIGHELRTLEAKKGVRVLYALESGSRCWGFASADSDYDVRFVYVRSKNDYLRLEAVRDTIEWRLDDELDIVGWDVAKFLRLMRGSNPGAFEWLGSTIVYREEPCFAAVREAAAACFDPVAHTHHYLGMATKHSVRYIKSGRPTLKRYLYVVRALLAARWAVEERTPVPMAFDDLCEAKLELDLVPVVEDLVVRKRQDLEGDMHEPIPALDRWMDEVPAEIAQQLQQLSPSRRVAWEVLDAVFLGLLDEVE
ncbi:MAG: nucleotidyltransferase domain-containing protein [Atopobiaceae bacterium]|nr:nucleotidyltransferase domain-containing protein [Atopobiaceae bacterium]